MPLGLRILQVFTIVNLVFSACAVALLKFLANNVSWFPKVLTSLLFNEWLATVFGSFIILFAIQFKHKLLYYLVFMVLGMNIFLSLRLTETQSLNASSITTTLFTLVPYLAFTWYWSRIKQYYLSSSRYTSSVSQADSTMKWIAILWIISFLTYSVISTINTQKAKYLQKIDIIKFVKLLDGKSYKERLEYCEVSVPTQSKNACLFAAFSMTKNKSNITLEDCNRITDETYYTFSCYAMGGYCDQLANPAIAESCSTLNTTLYAK